MIRMTGNALFISCATLSPFQVMLLADIPFWPACPGMEIIAALLFIDDPANLSTGSFCACHIICFRLLINVEQHAVNGFCLDKDPLGVWAVQFISHLNQPTSIDNIIRRIQNTFFLKLFSMAGCLQLVVGRTSNRFDLELINRLIIDNGTHGTRNEDICLCPVNIATIDTVYASICLCCLFLDYSHPVGIQIRYIDFGSGFKQMESDLAAHFSQPLNGIRSSSQIMT